MLHILVFFIVIIAVLHYAIRLTNKGQLIDKIPGPKGYPVIGNLLDFLIEPVPLFYLLRSFKSKFKRLHRWWFLEKPIVNLYDPDDVQVLLSSTKNIKKSDIYSYLQPWLGDGLLLSTGSKWHQRRKLLNPGFHFNILKQFCTIFEEHSWSLVDKLKTDPKAGKMNIRPLITQFTLNAVCETTMGVRLSKADSKDESYKKAIYILGDYIVHRLVRIWLHLTVIFDISTVGRKQRKLLCTLHAFTTDVIRKRRKLRSTIGETIAYNYDDDCYSASNKKRPAMLDLLLDAEQEGKIDELGIREEVDTFMFEGHDTTMLAIIYTLMQLANNPDIQKKVYEEMVEIFGGSDRHATADDLQNMKFLECCIKESLRLYPSVPFISRVLSEEMQLKDFLIPVDTIVNVFVYDLHRNPDHYHMPDKFDPNRFLPENAAGRHPYAYVPFSAGPRNCIGQKFAILEEKSAISAIIRNFEMIAITKPDDIVFRTDLVLRSDTPIYINFVPRFSPN